MDKITIDKKKNGYLFSIEGTVKNDGEYICKNTEEFDMLERIGEAIMGYKIVVERK